MYLDPSFGGLLLQIIVAVIAGGGAITFGMRRKIKAFFKKGKTKPTTSSDIKSSTTENVVDMMEGNDEK